MWPALPKGEQEAGAAHSHHLWRPKSSRGTPPGRCAGGVPLLGGAFLDSDSSGPWGLDECRVAALKCPSCCLLQTSMLGCQIFPLSQSSVCPLYFCRPSPLATISFSLSHAGSESPVEVRGNVRCDCQQGS